MTIATAFSRPGAGDLAAQVELDPSAVSSRRAPRSSMPRATPRISCSPISSRTVRREVIEPVPVRHETGETTLFEGEHGLLQVIEHPTGQQIAVYQFRLDVAQFGPGLIDPLSLPARHRQIEADPDHQMAAGSGTAAHLHQNARQFAALIVEVIRPFQLHPG